MSSSKTAVQTTFGPNISNRCVLCLPSTGKYREASHANCVKWCEALRESVLVIARESLPERACRRWPAIWCWPSSRAPYVPRRWPRS